MRFPHQGLVIMFTMFLAVVVTGQEPSHLRLNRQDRVAADTGPRIIPDGAESSSSSSSSSPSEEDEEDGVDPTSPFFSSNSNNNNMGEPYQTVFDINDTGGWSDDDDVAAAAMGQRQRGLAVPRNPWLTAHNRRRRHYHAQVYGVSYVPLRWSDSLAASAQRYANTLARTGQFQHSSLGVGENLAMNSGSTPASVDNVLSRWADDEAQTMGGHFTQVVWRATRYLGCGQAQIRRRPDGGGGGYVQVCHYVTPGNCNGSTLANMLADTSPCAPQCPAEGCF
jgi:Cysteine-rich secretory protein family